MTDEPLVKSTGPANPFGISLGLAFLGSVLGGVALLVLGLPIGISLFYIFSGFYLAWLVLSGLLATVLVSVAARISNFPWSTRGFLLSSAVLTVVLALLLPLYFLLLSWYRGSTSYI